MFARILYTVDGVVSTDLVPTSNAQTQRLKIRKELEGVRSVGIEVLWDYRGYLGG